MLTQQNIKASIKAKENSANLLICPKQFQIIFKTCLTKQDQQIYNYAIVSIKRHGRYVFISQEKIAKEMGHKDSSRVNKAFKKFQKLGLLTWVNRGYGRACFYAFPTFLSKFGCQMMVADVLPRFKHLSPEDEACYLYSAGYIDRKTFNEKIKHVKQQYEVFSMEIRDSRKELPATHTHMRARDGVCFKPSGEHTNVKKQSCPVNESVKRLEIQGSEDGAILPRTEKKCLALQELFSQPLVSIKGWLIEYEAEKKHKKKERLTRKKEKHMMAYKKYIEQFESITKTSMTILQQCELVNFSEHDVVYALKRLDYVINDQERILTCPYTYFMGILHGLRRERPKIAGA